MGVVRDDDPRRQFICKALAAVIASPAQQGDFYDYLLKDDSGSINSFLDDGSTTAIQASVSGLDTGQMQVKLSNVNEFPDRCEFQVIVTKLKRGPISQKDLPVNITISTVTASPLTSLYHSLHDVYSPLLGGVLGGTGDKGAISGRLQDLLQQLQAGLGSAVRVNQKVGHTIQVQDGDIGSLPLHDIVVPLDELDFWVDVTQSVHIPAAGMRAAQQVSAVLEGLRQQLMQVDNQEIDTWDTAAEVADAVVQSLRLAWPVRWSNGWAYSQQRATHFCRVVGAALVAYVQKRLKTAILWASPLSQLRPALEGASQLLQHWQEEVQALTRYWSLGVEAGGHQWVGEPLGDPYVAALQARIEEIHHMRSTHEELARLLANGDAELMPGAKAFSSFSSIDALQVSDFTLPLWKGAVQEYKQLMEPTEHQICQKLREMINGVLIPSLTAAATHIGSSSTSLLAQPQQLFQHLCRFRGLLSRQSVSSALHQEMEALSKALERLLDGVQQELGENRARAGTIQSSRAAATAHSSPALGIADVINWAVRAQAKTSSLISTITLLMGNSAAEDHATSALSAALAIAMELQQEVNAFKVEQFDVWQEQMRGTLSDMSQWKHGKLMTCDSHNSHIRTYFNDQLVLLIREVRQLQTLGFSIKKDIMSEVDVAQRFYRYGMVLKQHANFYNNISTQMVPCQKPMMLKDALDFEKVLMNPRDAQGGEITWRSASALDGYVRRLNTVADQLAQQNRQLWKWHQVLAEKVVQLMGTDLVRSKEKWAQGVREMRDLFQHLETKGFSGESQQVWRQHWDYQLYKALRHQYSLGLEAINKTLPEMEIKMVFKQHRLQYEPALEELRIRHYKDCINTFLGLPLKMKGVSDLSERAGFFRPIAEANPASIAQVYSAVEALFVQLNEELKKYQDWVALGNVDLDEAAEQQLEEVGDWESNFRALKAVARDAEKLPSELCVDCYRISLLPVKQTVDEHMKRLQEALVASLRRKVASEKQLVEEFMKRGTKMLEQDGGGVEEIGLARQQATELVLELPAMLQVRRRIDDKNKLLRQMAGGGQAAHFAAVDMSDVNNSWDAFTGQLHHFDAHLEERTAQLQAQIVGQMAEFRACVAGFFSRWQELKPKGAPNGSAAMVLARLNESSHQVEELQHQAQQYQRDCAVFRMEAPEFDVLSEAVADIAATKLAWQRYGDFLKERDELANRDWLSVRDQVWKVEDFLVKWSKDSGSMQGAADSVALSLLNEIEVYRRCLPYLKMLRGSGWEDAHWAQLFSLLGLKASGAGAVSRETVTLAHFLDKAETLAANADKIKSLDAQAQAESVLRKAISELKMWSLQKEFVLTDISVEGGGKVRKVALVKEWKDVQTEIGDHQSLVASLKQSPYHHIFKEEILGWEMKLAWLQEGLGLLNQVQRKWLYLQPIFARGALPQQQPRFRSVDDEFRQLMQHLEVNCKVAAFAEVGGLREKLPSMVSVLEACQRALSDFLEEKRSLFPRFYFLGDDDLLEILGQARNPQVIQAHLKKLFAGIHKVQFNQDQSGIIKMCSIEGEMVRLSSPVQVTEAIEAWLAQLSVAMKQTLAAELGAISRDSSSAESSQVLCLLEAVQFTARVEGAIEHSSLQSLRSAIVKRLEEVVGGDYTGQSLLKLRQQALVIDFIHFRDVVELLIAQRTTSKTDWNWTRQLRYYHKQDGVVEVQMAEARMRYSWEYQGNAARLVYTPLTDKCYLTLTQGMALGYGGNPYGPAGTGKTESVKALGQALARQVLVFNCDEEFDFKAMGRIFVGLVQCGAWGCFDEFNRLDEEVLSAVSQQIQIIQTSLKEGAKKMEFMEKTIDVDGHAGIFVTLNPAGKGYGGRSKLPDNLKQLFRSVAMTAPDNDLIAEVLLLAEGFVAARELGCKLVSLFALAKQLLSPQQHYDWGLRALKTCLATAGKELRQAKGGANISLAVEQEASVLIRAVGSIKLPSLIYEDTARFTALLGDLFPGIIISGAQDAALEAAVLKVAADMQLQLADAQVDKILQLHAACEQRIGVIVVGPSGSGKSLLWQNLEKAYELQGRRPVVYKINPKAMPRQQLLGQMNLDTREWTDGVLTAAARKVQKEPLEQRSWIVCDGDVDPEWIESLNSVLDDNRLLTMPNGERIQFASNINFIFECDSLEYASPATISRCGMIFLSDESLDVERMMQQWLVSQPADSQGSYQSWIKDIFYKAFSWACGHPTVLETTKIGLLHNALSHIAGCTTKKEFAAAVGRGLGSTMAPATRAAFLALLGGLAGCGADVLSADGDGDPLAALEDSVHDEAHAGIDLVLTQEVRHNLAALSPWLKDSAPFLLVGPEGCGKATLLEYCLKRMKDVQVATVSCSAQTTAANVIQKLVQMCGKPVTTTTGKVLRSATGRIVLYLKDINLPQPDKYGTIQLIAFLQQLLTYGGYYDDALEFIQLDRIQIVGSMTPASTVGRHALSTRFTARMRVACIDYPSLKQLHVIVSSCLRSELASSEDPSWGSAQKCESLAAAMLDVYSQVLATFLQNDHWHYQFTPRDLSAWVHGLKAYSLHGCTLLEAALHEGCRVFSDRLVGADAVATFNALLLGVFKAQLGFAGSLPGFLCSTLGASSEDRLSRDPAKLRLVRWEVEDFTELVAQKLKAFEREVRELRLCLFPQLLETVARVDRVVAQPGGSALMVGSSGTGRRSAVMLVCYMHHVDFFTPRMGVNYDAKAFRADLKDVLRKAGLEGKAVCIFLEDHQLGHSSVLQAVNSLLSGGEVPGLFTNEELAKELPALEARRTQDLSAPPSGSLFDYFSLSVQRNLHIVVSLDASSPEYRSRCDANPALFTRCSCLWMDGWATRSMEAVAMAALQGVKQQMGATPPADVVSLLSAVHQTHGTDSTPRQYLACVNTFSAILTMKHEQLKEQTRFLQGGLDKLAEASTTVDVLSRDADRQRSLLKTKQAEAEEALTRITASMEQAADRRKEVEVLRARLAAEEVELNQRRGGVESELESVQPLIDTARKAVGGIKADNINEIRSLKMPPEPIRDVLEGVLQLMGQEDTSWNSMKKFLGHKAVKDDIVSFDAHRITPEIRVKVERLLQAKGQSFEQATIYRVSVAAAPMAAWVKANVAYSKVLDKVAPLERELQGLMASLLSSQERLAHCQQELAELDSTVVRLKADFQHKTSEAESLKIGLQRAEATLQAAASLLDKLSDEKERWSFQVKSLASELTALPINALMTAAFITYLPALPEDAREAQQEAWLKDAGLPSYDLCRFMSSESEILTWKAQGLPADVLSLQNAVVIIACTLTPLIIDPSLQALGWLKSHLQAGGTTLDLSSLHDPRFSTTLELAVRFGKTLIITEVDSIHPVLFPLLRMDLERQGPRSSVHIGDKLVDYSDTFRMFLFTRAPNPSLPPDARALLTVTNFTVTRSGLEGQLLGLTLEQEQPELEAQKSALLQQEEQLKVQLAAVEKQLLHTLATSTGNILENSELLARLNDAKSKSGTIAASLRESSALTASLDKQRDAYRPFAQRASAMFFLLRDLRAISPMYAFSLAMFLRLFRRALARQSPAGDVSSRLALLASTLLELLLASISRSLFNSDRLTFAMHLTHSLQPALFPPHEWAFFLGRSSAAALAPPPAKPSWVREESAGAYAQLVTAFPALGAAAGLQDAGAWAPWVSSPAVDAPLPTKVAEKLQPFQHLLLVKTFRPDRLQSAMVAFISQALGTKALGGGSSSIKGLVEAEASGEEPILFITTPGADPSQELGDYACSKMGRSRYHEVAMGQGQAPLALHLLRECARTGEWLCLKNCHLVVGWLAQLEKEVFALQRHPDFRLFLTSEPNPKFPASLLEASLKVTFEAPPGVKRNLQRTYDAWPAEYLRAGSSLRAQLLFVLAWFHAVVQERRTYIPQGWTQFYEFSFADLRAAADIIGLSTRGGGSPQWQYLRGLMELAIYGGRIDNPYDVKVLRAYLDQLFSPELLGVGGAKLPPLPGTRIVAPSSGHPEDHAAAIAALPDTDSPALFGLPANIDKTVHRASGDRVVALLRQMSRSQDAAAGFSRQQWASQLGPLLRLWETLLASSPALKQVLQEPPGLQGPEAAAPVDSFVALQRAFGRRLIGVIDKCLASIGRVLRGVDTLTSDVQVGGAALLADTIPAHWESVWEGPATPQEYCSAVVARAAAIERWHQRCGAGSLLSAALDLSALFHPATFLNALRQQSARALGVPMDALKLATCWNSNRLQGSPPSLTAQLGGLLVQGAQFDGVKLVPVDQDSPSLKEVPPMYAAWIPQAQSHPYASYFTAPLHATLDRSHPLADVQLPISGPEEVARWILAGVALFCSP